MRPFTPNFNFKTILQLIFLQLCILALYLLQVYSVQDSVDQIESEVISEVQYAVNESTIFEPLSMFGSETFPESYFIDGQPRFEFYEKLFGKKRENKAIIDSIDILNAYEYEYEYSISYLTPAIEKHKVFCRYLDKDGKELLPAYQTFSWPEFVVICPKRYGTRKIAITTNRRTKIKTSHVKALIDRQANDPIYNFSVCLAPIYGNEPKWLLFSEFIEHYKLQGATRFYVYVRSIDEYSKRIVEDYKKTGEVDLIDLPEINADNDDYLLAAHRDCLLRSRHESRWAAFVDLDERLLMTGYPGTILDYLNEDMSKTVTALRFVQQFVMRTERMPDVYRGSLQIDNWLPAMRWHNTSNFGPSGFKGKFVVDPTSTLTVSLHGPMLTLPDTRGIDLHPSDGVSRHYRYITSDDLDGWPARYLPIIRAFGHFRETDYPQKYRDTLLENVKKRVRIVYGTPSH